MPDLNEDNVLQPQESYASSEVDAHEIRDSSRFVPVATVPTTKDDLYYNMHHSSRGIALIFNHMNFKKSYLEMRKGTDFDCKNLRKVLENLGFEVTVENDPSYEKIKKRIEETASADHSKNDCLLIAVLTYGTTGRLHAKDSCYKPDFIWDSFTADKCPTLAGKPKLFFVQACQEPDMEIELTKRTAVDGSSSKSTYKIPIHADFLIAYSKLSGTFSWRNADCGSWFVQALVEELAECCEPNRSRNLLSMLTKVNQKVALKYDSIPSDFPKPRSKHIPSFSSMLTRILIFEKKVNH